MDLARETAAGFQRGFEDGLLVGAGSARTVQCGLGPFLFGRNAFCFECLARRSVQTTLGIIDRRGLLHSATKCELRTLGSLSFGDDGSFQRGLSFGRGRIEGRALEAS